MDLACAQVIEISGFLLYTTLVMERFTELSVVLKSFPYQERDRIVVVLTENRGKVTALAKGAISSKRFAGSLDFLACSKIQFIQKPFAEMARIEEAQIYYEFKNLSSNFSTFTAASFVAEFCTHLIEPETPSREIFIYLTQFLVFLDHGALLLFALNAFLCKAFRALGYSPQTKLSKEQDKNLLLYFHKLSTTTFKELQWVEKDPHDKLFQILSNFLHLHIPGVPTGGFKTWKLLNEVLAGSGFHAQNQFNSMS